MSLCGQHMTDQALCPRKDMRPQRCRLVPAGGRKAVCGCSQAQPPLPRLQNMGEPLPPRVPADAPRRQASLQAGESGRAALTPFRCVLAALSPAGGAFLFRPRVHGRPGFQLRPLHTGPGVVGKRQLPSLGSALGGGVCSLLRGGSEPAQQGKGAPEENRASPTPSPPWGPPPDQDFALESRVRSCGQSTRTDSIVCADVSGCVWGDAVHPRPAPCPRGTSFQGCPRTRRLGPSAGANQGNRTCLFQRAAASAP